MDEKYVYDPEMGYVLEKDGEVDRQSFKAFAPEYLDVERAKEQLITREMRHRDYDYVYAEDPYTIYASFSFEELIWHNAHYEERMVVWDELVSEIGETEEGQVTLEMFKN